MTRKSKIDVKTIEDIISKRRKTELLSEIKKKHRKKTRSHDDNIDISKYLNLETINKTNKYTIEFFSVFKTIIIGELDRKKEDELSKKFNPLNEKFNKIIEQNNEHLKIINEMVEITEEYLKNKSRKRDVVKPIKPHNNFLNSRPSFIPPVEHNVVEPRQPIKNFQEHKSFVDEIIEFLKSLFATKH